MTGQGTFEALGLNGSALAGELVIDAHMHIGTYYNFLVPRPALADLVASARRIGIRHMYGSSLQAIRGDLDGGNQAALAGEREHPGMFFAYLVASPNDPEDIRGVIDLAESTRVRRFKIHDDGNDLPYDHPHYEPLYQYADSVQAVVLAHTYGGKHVRPLQKVAERYRKMSILLGHAGIVEEEAYADAVRACENILLETCSSLAWYGLIERLVNMAGPERVLFGTDMPFMSPDQQIGRVLFARLSDDVKRRILGLNAKRILG